MLFSLSANSRCLHSFAIAPDLITIIKSCLIATSECVSKWPPSTRVLTYIMLRQSGYPTLNKWNMTIFWLTYLNIFMHVNAVSDTNQMHLHVVRHLLTYILFVLSFSIRASHEILFRECGPIPDLYPGGADGSGQRRLPGREAAVGRRADPSLQGFPSGGSHRGTSDRKRVQNI